jgi:DNA end-binding protein Ku
VGALRAVEGRLMLLTLRQAEQMTVPPAVPPPDRPLAERELRMAEQLVAALHDTFAPQEYRNEYRQRVMDLVAHKASGQTLRLTREAAPRPEPSLAKALEASLKQVREKSNGRSRRRRAG